MEQDLPLTERSLSPSSFISFSRFIQTGIKAIVNEKFGDGIMSAIDMYATVEKVKGSQGEDRVLVTLNGKFLPHVEQRVENNVQAPVVEEGGLKKTTR